MMMNSKRLFAASSLAIVLVGFQVDAWVLVLGVIFLAWKGSVEYLGLAKPSRWLTNTLTLLFLGLILLKYRTIAGQESSASFLVLLTSLKLLEERTLRDQKFLLLLGFVLLSSLFLFTLEIPSLVGGIAAFYLLWTSQSSEVTYAKHFLRALPYVLFLFLFFPRVQNPFGLQGVQDQTGSTGFSDDLNPGSISKLQDSRELAFRVQFLTPRNVRVEDQYWRGQILSIAEGLRWTKKPSAPKGQSSKSLPSPDYEVTIEPHSRRWLFTWDPTSQIHSKDFLPFSRDGLVYESAAPIRERAKYTGLILLTQEPATSENILLQSSEKSTRVLEFAETVHQNNDTRAARADAFVRYFQQNGFRYTKSPGTGSSTLESFLFTSKRGYCEHYAAALATLLRLAEVPARVVTGYQGGQYNAYGRFWRFTQADAHAWVEFVNDANEWQRVDPTSVVAPERTQLGGILFEDLPEEWIGQNKSAEFLKSRESFWIRTRDLVRDNIESFNYDVVLFLIDFNLERQKELLSEYGLWIGAVAILLLVPFFMQSLWRRRKLSESEWLLRELERKAKTFNLSREASETVRHFIERWSEQQPHLKNELSQLLQSYEGSVYAKRFEGFELRTLKKLLAQLRADTKPRAGA